MSGQLDGACHVSSAKRADEQPGEPSAARPCPSAHHGALVYLLSHGLLEMNDEVQAAMASTDTDFSDLTSGQRPALRPVTRESVPQEGNWTTHWVPPGGLEQLQLGGHQLCSEPSPH